MTLNPTVFRLSLAATLVAGLTPVAAARAAAGPLWLSLDLGTALALTQDDYQQQVDDSGQNVTVADPDTARLAWRVGAGWDLWRPASTPLTLAAQLAWFNLGPVDLDYSGSVNQSQLEAMYDDLKSIHPESGDGLALGLTGQWRGIGRPALALGAELGATYWRQTYDLRGVDGDTVRTDDRSGAGWYAGLSADYRLTPRVSARGGWRAYGLDSESVQTLSLGLTFRPGWTRAASRPEPEPAAPPAPAATPQPVPPRGRADTARVDQGDRATLPVLANDVSPAGRPLRITWVEGSPAAHLAIGPDGRSVDYRHRGGDADTDRFEYWLSDGTTEVGPIPVTVQVRSLRPQARPDRYRLPAGTANDLDVLANDTDPSGRGLVITRVSQPEGGRVEVIDGVVVYDNTGAGREADHFQYWVGNGRYEAGPIRVEIRLEPRDGSDS